MDKLCQGIPEGEMIAFQLILFLTKISKFQDVIKNPLNFYFPVVHSENSNLTIYFVIIST